MAAHDSKVTVPVVPSVLCCICPVLLPVDSAAVQAVWSTTPSSAAAGGTAAAASSPVCAHACSRASRLSAAKQDYCASGSPAGPNFQQWMGLVCGCVAVYLTVNIRGLHGSAFVQAEYLHFNFGSGQIRAELPYSCKPWQVRLQLRGITCNPWATATPAAGPATAAAS